LQRLYNGKKEMWDANPPAERFDDAILRDVLVDHCGRILRLRNGQVNETAKLVCAMFTICYYR
jgi:hypothetical protein